MADSEPMDTPSLRVGDADRTAALDRLGLYFAGGHLDVAEFDERSGKAAVARVRGEIDALFADLPPLDDATAPASQSQSATVKTVDSAQAELSRVMNRAQVVQRVDAAAGAIAMAVMFLSIFVLHWPYFWIVFLISAGVSGVVRKVYQLTPEEERLYQKLSDSQKRERMKRLEQAAERRKDLGL